MNIDSKISQTITLCRFPLIVLVVMLHSGAAYSSVEGGGLAQFFSAYFTRIAVPLFFCISGYLFFYNFSLESYFVKIRKRIKNLLVPYFFWNIVFIAAFFVFQTLFQTSFDRKPISDWALSDFLWSFWDIRHIHGYELNSGGVPFHSHLWFLRDLFMMALLSPLFFFLLKYMKSVIVFVALLLWLFLPFDFFYYIKNESFLFFLIGGYMQINAINILAFNKKQIIKGISLVTIINLLLAPLFDYSSFVGAICTHMYILSGCYVFFVLMSYINNEKKKFILSKLSDSTFFIYGCHGLFVAILSKFILSRVSLTTINISISFVSTWLIALSASLLLYLIIKRFIPWALIFTGGKR